MLALPPASQPAPRRQVFVGTAVAGAAGCPARAAGAGAVALVGFRLLLA